MILIKRTYLHYCCDACPWTLELTNAISDGGPRPCITGYGGHLLLTCTVKPVPIPTAVGDDIRMVVGWLEISLHKNSWLKVGSCASYMNHMQGCGRGSCYGGKLNSYILEHSRSKDRFQWDILTSSVTNNSYLWLTKTLEVKTSHWNLSLLRECSRKYFAYARSFFTVPMLDW